MIWRLLARTVAGVHIAYTLFVVFGVLLVWRWPQLMLLHIAVVAWAGLVLMFDLGCPLTPMEKGLWERGGIAPYREGFVQHHVLRTQFPPQHERRNHALLGAGAILLNLVAYIALLRG
jgi:hypothetical protein